MAPFLKRFILVAFFICSLGFVVAQSETDSPEQVVQKYFEAFTNYEFEPMIKLLHSDYVESVRNNIALNLKNGAIENIPYFLQDKNPDEIVEMDPYIVALEWDLHLLQQLGSSISEYEVTTRWHGFDGEGRAYVVAHVIYGGDRSTTIMVPLEQDRDAWKITTMADLLALNGIFFQ